MGGIKYQLGIKIMKFKSLENLCVYGMLIYYVWNTWFVQVKVRKQYPLTSIMDIIYEKDQNPLAFKLVFQKTEMLLEASSEQDCELWVDAITRGMHNVKWSRKYILKRNLKTVFPFSWHC